MTTTYPRSKPANNDDNDPLSVARVMDQTLLMKSQYTNNGKREEDFPVHIMAG